MKAFFEQVQPLPENSFRVFLHEVNEFDAPWHYHPEFELTFILASEGIRYVGNNMENFREGDLVLVGPNLPHCWKNTANGRAAAGNVQAAAGNVQEAAAGGQAVAAGHRTRRVVPANGRATPVRTKKVAARAIVVQWQEQFLGDGWMEKPEFHHIRRLLLQARQGVKFSAETAGQVREMMLRLLQRPPFGKLVQLLEVLDLLAGAADTSLLCKKETTYPLNFEDNERINTVCNYIREHYPQKITLSSVASLVHMNEEAFSRFFSKIMRKPFFTFLNEYRITTARKLLVETDMQAARIAFSCGYESLPFFYRQFSRYAKMPPQS